MPIRGPGGYNIVTPKILDELDGANYKGEQPYLASEAMFRIFDAPALADLERRFKMAAMGSPIENVIPPDSGTMRNFEKYFGKMPLPRDVSVPSQLVGYDANEQPIMDPGYTYKVPSFFPGGVESWAQQQIAGGNRLPEPVLGAAGLLGPAMTGLTLAPITATSLSEQKSDLIAQKQEARMLADLRRTYPYAKDDSVLVQQMQYQMNQATRGRLYPQATAPNAEDLGPSKQASKEIHEKFLQAEKAAADSSNWEKRIAAQKARQDSINDTAKGIAGQKNARLEAKDLREHELKVEKSNREKIIIAMRVYNALEDAAGPEEAFRVAQALAGGTPLEDIEQSPAMRAQFRKLIQQQDTMHNAKLAKIEADAKRVDNANSKDSIELKLMEQKRKNLMTRTAIANAERKLLEFGLKDPQIQAEHERTKRLVSIAAQYIRMGEDTQAQQILDQVAPIWGVDPKDKGMVDTFIEWWSPTPVRPIGPPPKGPGLQVPSLGGATGQMDQLDKDLADFQRSKPVQQQAPPIVPQRPAAPPISTRPPGLPAQSVPPTQQKPMSSAEYKSRVREHLRNKGTQP